MATVSPHQPARPLPPVGPPPPFDPELTVALAGLADPSRPSMTSQMIAEVRSREPVVPPATDEDLRCGGAFSVEHAAAPGPDGAPDVPLLVCRPAAALAPTPAICYLHGGGMVVGSYRDGLADILDLTQELSLAVVSVDYRLAPETRHPGPVEDCYAALAWIAAHAADLGVDPDRVVVAGVSAGGGLAAAVALMARDRGGPALVGQLLVCPMLDDHDTPSAVQMAGLGVWDRTSNATGWTALLGEARGGPSVPAYAAPARATDLAGLPPAFVDVGSAETFRDEDVTYASRIWAAGGQAELHVWPGGFHAFDAFAPEAALSTDARAARERWLRRLLRPRQPPEAAPPSPAHHEGGGLDDPS